MTRTFETPLVYLEQLKAFGRVNRFPDARVVTIAYYALVSADAYDIVAGNFASEAGWFSIAEVPKLVYDHQMILDTGLKHLQHKVRHEPIGFNLLPEKFTLLQLQELYEAILNTKLDKPNFRRKILKMNLLTPCNEKQTGVAHRAANLYRFDPPTICVGSIALQNNCTINRCSPAYHPAHITCIFALSVNSVYNISGIIDIV